ncbi:hypothetical protein [Streptomyces sp. NPDC051704]|uniref:hypothetical protein n=1 Tax=Streptomyces sp. NPDC051704 TaxID=3365671 RepID=UPI0037BDF2BC
MATTLRTTARISVSEHLRDQLAAHHVTAHHTDDRADTYLTLLREDQAVITISGLTTTGNDVSVTHTPANHAGWLATLRTPDHGYEIVYDTYDREVPYEVDTTALLASVLRTLRARTTS